MATAYYMTYKKGHSGSQDRIGGQPTHIPSSKPWPPEDDDYYGFLMQLWVDGVRLKVPNTICLQLYQAIPEGSDPQPVVVQIPPDAALNRAGDVLVHPDAEDEEWDIGFEEATDPDVLPEIVLSPEIGKLFKSKLGGLDPWEEYAGERVFLGQIDQTAADFNFADMNCSLYLESSGRVTAELY